MSLYAAPLASVVESINRLNNLDLVADQYNFGTPTPTTAYGSFANTELSVTAKDAQSAYAGTVTVAYKRLDLADLATQVTLVVPVNGHTTTMDIASAVNKRFGTLLTSDDIVVRPLTALEQEYPGSILLEAKSTSYGWIGSVTVETREGDYALAEHLTAINIDGLNYPTAVTTRPYAHIYSYPVDYSASQSLLSQVQVGTGELEQVRQALIAAQPTHAWTLTGTSRYSLEGATVIEVGDVASLEGYNPRYDHVVRVRLSDTYSLGLTGDLVLHYNDPV